MTPSDSAEAVALYRRYLQWCADRAEDFYTALRWPFAVFHIMAIKQRWKLEVRR